MTKMLTTSLQQDPYQGKGRFSLKTMGNKLTAAIRIKSPSLRTKLILPYVLLALAVGVVAAYLVTNVILSSWTERFNNQLITAADEAADIIVRREQAQLTAWRQIAFTQGVAEAAAAQDIAALEQLVAPVFHSHDSSRVDILNMDGSELLHMDLGTVTAAVTDYPEWELVQRVQADPVNRYAGLQLVGDQVVFYTAGAITTDTGETSGILLVGAPLNELAASLEESVLAGITLYGPDGQLLATTIGQADPAALALTPDEAEAVLASQGKQTSIRTIAPAGDEHAQIHIPFELGQGEDVGIVGVSLRLNLLASPLYPARRVVTVVFTAAVAATLLIGYILATGIIRPVEQLMLASRKVAQGDLTVQVPATSGDEIGQLTKSFNEMVNQLNRRRHVERLFGSYVGNNIAQRILDGEVELGGQRVYATVLFADIRDFTAFTEKADLGELIDELNEYYTVMQRVIDANGGVINKFGGDSILALFGAPLPYENHPHRAVTAAVQMMDQLAELNQRRLSRGDAPFRIGIGVNTGEMIVGNLGSEYRREYTVLGDSVNTAKRLSDLNKDTPLHSIFISDSTLRELHGANGWQHGWQMENLGQIHVKGKEEAVTVYALMRAPTMQVPA